MSWKIVIDSDYCCYRVGEVWCSNPDNESDGAKHDEANCPIKTKEEGDDQRREAAREVR